MRWIVVLALLLAGCGGAQSVSDAKVPRYIGKPIGLVFKKWGQPDRTIPAEGGNIYQWKATDSSGICRLEAHANNPLYGDRDKTVIGIHFTGENSTCASWLGML